MRRLEYGQRSVPAAFWDRCRPNPEKLFEGTPCWEWTGSLNGWGYGSFWDQKSWPAHRWVALRQSLKRNKAALYTDHLCENKLCVNPLHLELVTNEENVRRAHARAALAGRTADRRAWNHRSHG